MAMQAANTDRGGDYLLRLLKTANVQVFGRRNDGLSTRSYAARNASERNMSNFALTAVMHDGRVVGRICGNRAAYPQKADVMMRCTTIPLWARSRNQVA